MRKFLPSALAAVAVTTALLTLPTGTAAAQSTACSTAVDLINAANTANNGTLDDAAQKDLANKLLAVNASGPDRDAITAFAKSLLDDNVTDMNAAIAKFNTACA
ncbi:hypothetical protein ACIP5Y_47340 [Nocardia sp. NPDC088792]|uniref:hypothetical protein n=1 Tax=Nocardia sp. NPDC088792 TaxID=3364332 RepID=UPI00382971FF